MVINCTTIETPLGEALAVANGEFICYLNFISPRAQQQIQRMFPGAKQILQQELPVFNLLNQTLKAYFSGELKIFDVPIQLMGTDFQKSVWKALQHIPFGQTRSYLQLAQSIGQPKAQQAVGAANGANPILLLVPCHRVISSNGQATGYSGGLERKHWLLKHEFSHS